VHVIWVSVNGRVTAVRFLTPRYEVSRKIPMLTFDHPHLMLGRYIVGRRDSQMLTFMLQKCANIKIDVFLDKENTYWLVSNSKSCSELWVSKSKWLGC
jgi:hypothetical protein